MPYTLTAAPVDPTWCANPSGRSVVKAVLRRMVPYVIEATLIPTVLFYTFLVVLELKWAVIAAVVWTYAAVARRIILRLPVPGLLVLATLGVTVRTIAYLLSGNSFVYFFQPIMRTVAMATFFALSVTVGRPLVARFASDFCSFTPEVESRPAITELFRRLTYLWAIAQGVAAAISLTLLLTVPVPVFVGAATASAWIITCSGIVLTVFDSVRTARSDGLHTAVAPGGRLHAYVATAT